MENMLRRFLCLSHGVPSSEFHINLSTWPWRRGFNSVWVIIEEGLRGHENIKINSSSSDWGRIFLNCLVYMWAFACGCWGLQALMEHTAASSRLEIIYDVINILSQTVCKMNRSSQLGLRLQNGFIWLSAGLIDFPPAKFSELKEMTTGGSKRKRGVCEREANKRGREIDRETKELAVLSFGNRHYLKFMNSHQKQACEIT